MLDDKNLPKPRRHLAVSGAGSPRGQSPLCCHGHALVPENRTHRRTECKAWHSVPCEHKQWGGKSLAQSVAITQQLVVKAKLGSRQKVFKNIYFYKVFSKT